MSPLPRKSAPPSSFSKWTSGTLSSPGSPGVGARPDLGRDLTRQSAEDPVHPQDERLIAVPGDRLIDRGALERELLAVLADEAPARVERDPMARRAFEPQHHDEIGRASCRERV